MNYHMRRSDREIQDADSKEAIIKNGKYAIMALCKDNEPYIVTLSYGYDAATRSLYFHGAKEGLKLDFLKANPRVCATIIEDQGYIFGECSHAYRTVVIRGEMEFLENDAERVKGIEVMINHFEKDPAKMMAKVHPGTGTWTNTVMMRLTITEITGKERKKS
jgi:nitroimidazol reductase NimA-like FMN-containing flavoprotein (pyridoxamine 5'-phosphate oxidase superfamily)